MQQLSQRPTVDTTAFRQVMGVVCSQVVIVTTMVGDVPHGTTVTAFASLSLDPPLVSIALDESSKLLQQIRLRGQLGVNLLARGQESLAIRCAGKGRDKFDTVPWTPSQRLPRIDGSAGWLACEVQDEILLGDHVLVVALVTDSEVPAHETAPMVYAGRTFGTHSDWLDRDPQRTHRHDYQPLDQYAEWTN